MKSKQIKIKCEHKHITKWKNGLRQCSDCLAYWQEKPKILNPNCSEYICRYHLSKNEKKQAKQMANSINLSPEDIKLLFEYFDDDNAPLGFCFTDEQLKQPYELITGMILKHRSAQIAHAVAQGKLTKQEAQELEHDLTNDKTLLDWEPEDILNNYKEYKSKLAKAKVLIALQPPTSAKPSKANKVWKGLRKGKLLNPNCSEQVFRLTGSLEKIRKEMLNVIDWIEQECMTSYGWIDADGKERKKPSKSKKNISVERDEELRGLRAAIKQAKNIKDFEELVITFTCNYETFFKVDGNGKDLLVATCNNYDYDNVDKHNTDEDYYKTAGYHYFSLVDKMEGYKVFYREPEEEDDKSSKPTVIIVEEGVDIPAHSDGTFADIKFVIRGDKAFVVNNNKLVPLPVPQNTPMYKKVKVLACLNADNNEYSRYGLKKN